MADAGYGCSSHGVTDIESRRLWELARGLERQVAMCECCCSPAAYVPVRLAGGNEMGVNFLCVACGGAGRGGLPPPTSSALLDEARKTAPLVHLTLRATANTEGDVRFLRRVAATLGHYPGGNLIRMRVVTVEGRAQVLVWRAYSCRRLRRTLANMLTERAKEDSGGQLAF